MEFGGSTWRSGKWLGVLNRDLDVIIDLGAKTDVSKVIVSCISDPGASIFFPVGIEVLGSDDGETFSRVKGMKTKASEQVSGLDAFTIEFERTERRYIQVKAECLDLPGTGEFVFVDEIVVF